MALKSLIPEAVLTYDHPAAGGMVTEYGYSRDWRLTALWQGRYVEYIDPLAAIAPAGVIYPRDMVLADWTVGYNAVLSEWYADSYPSAKGLLFRDGQVWPAETELEDYLCVAETDAEDLPPNFVLHTIRSAPPPGQGVIPSVGVSIKGHYFDGTDWDAEGRITLIVPRHNETRRNPFLHVYVGAWADLIDVFADGDIVSDGPSTSSMSQGVIRESWVFETAEIWQDSDGAIYGEYDTGRTFVRTHILIRNINDMGAWWHWSTDKFRCAQETPWSLSIAGAVTWVNMVPIYYGEQDGYCWAPTAGGLPSVTGSTWNEAASPWDGIASNVASWDAPVVSQVASTPPGASHRPRIDFNRTATAGQHKRPIAWFAYEEHPAVIEVPGDLPAQETTADGNTLRRVTYEQNNRWKGARGTAEFYPSTTAPHPNWVANGLVQLAVGLAPIDPSSNDPALALAQIATGYIMPDGLKRRRSGDVRSGGPQLTVEFGDFAAARLPQKDIVDQHQAALNRVDLWAVLVANRMGIPSTAVTVDAGVAEKVIPYNELPSLPNIAPQDGDSWLSHIEEVERAAGIRVCFDYYGTGGMQVDAGPPKYTTGVSPIAFTLSDATATLEDQITEIEAARDGSRFRNFLKVNYGNEANRKALYYSEATATREAGIGDDWPTVVNADQTTSSDDVLAEFLREHYRWGLPVVWSGPLRRHLRPDQFVRVQVGHIGVANNTVLQIITHRTEVCREDMTARSVCLCAPVVNA